MFKPYLDRFVIIFIDDILIYSKSQTEHEQHLRVILQMLREHQLYAKLSKCKFWLQEVDFLGHTICKDGIRVDLKKIEAVVQWTRLTNVTKIKSFFSLVDYYRKFIQDFFKIVAPMTQLTRKHEPLVWKDAYEQSF